MLCLLALPAWAEVILAEHDWDPTPADGVWTALGGAAGVSLSVTNTAAPHNNWLRVEFPDNDNQEPGEHWYETVKVDVADFFVGTWSTQMWVSFDFWAETAVPEELEVRWHSTASNNLWSYPLTGAQAGQWTTFSAPLANWEDWTESFVVGIDDYLADLESIDWIGVYIFRDGTTDPEIYGLDDFKLTVPEPEEYAMLLAGLVTALLVYRTRRQAAPACAS
jgi:hypothetical protein